jgi:2-aminophenol/2-amino-5-chlorophenol 1,6-dioxygenase alpha subunit
MTQDSIIAKVLIVPGNPHILLAPEKNTGWASLRRAYDRLRKDIETVEADLILYMSTQWMSVIGHLFQVAKHPEWVHVDHNWHDLGSIPYKFNIDSDFGHVYCREMKKVGAQAATVDYQGFPIDTGSIVAQKLLNPDNRLPASMVSCNIYIEKDKCLSLGQGAARALRATGKKAIVVLVTNLSNRQFNHVIDPREDRIYSAKDDEWNRKIIELLSEGRLEDVDQCAREFAREAGADLGFKGIWWLNGLCGQNNDFKGKSYDYQAVGGAGAALLSLTPMKKASREVSMRGEEGGESRQGGIDSLEAPEAVGPYPHARRYGDFLLLSGVGPRKRGQSEIPGVTLSEDGEVLDYAIEIQTRQVIENVKVILEAAGSSLEKVVDVTAFLTNIKNDFEIYNKVYRKHFEKIAPTRTTLGISALPTPIAVEFKVLAKP